MTDQIQIKQLEELAEVSDTDEIAVQRKSDGKLYRSPKSEVKGDKGDVGPIGPQGPQGLEGDTGEKGDPGDAATVDVHSTETGDPGTDANVTNEGTTSAALFKFIIPRGDKGQTGDTGPCVESVVFVGNDMVFTLDDSSTVTLINAKTDLTGDTGDNVELRVEGSYIQWKLTEATEWQNLIALVELKGDKGDKGDIGDTGIVWKGSWTAGEYSERDAVEKDGTSYIATTTTSETPSNIATDWDVLALKGIDGEGSGDMLKATYDPAGGEKQVAFDDDDRLSDDRTPLEHGNEAHDPNFEDQANKTTSFQETPDNTKYPTEKLVKDSLDGKLSNITGESIGDLSDVTLTAEKTLTITESTTLSGGTHSGNNTGDQVLPTRDSLGLDTDDSPQFEGIELGHASDTTLSRSAAGVLAVEGADVAMAANAMGSINHGATADTARPTGYYSITWIGTVSPDNATNNDIWIDVT